MSRHSKETFAENMLQKMDEKPGSLGIVILNSCTTQKNRKNAGKLTNGYDVQIYMLSDHP
jgi:predicted alternative tryptophan synthase beta-subunit